MPGAAPVTAPPAAYMLPAVKLFASGTYRDKDWPPAAIDEIAANARLLGPTGKRLLLPPAVLGHEEEQDRLVELLDRTDTPAAGWVDVTRVRVIPDPDPDYPGEKILVGDVVNIPDAVATEIDKGTYRFGSAEIYDDFTDDKGRSYGKALRRFALLGAEVPQVKRLGPLPKPVRMAAPVAFAERAGRYLVRVRRIGLSTYAEVTGVDRNSLMQAAKAAMPGISQATLDGLTDDQLADLIKNLPSPAMSAASSQANPSAPSGAFAEGCRGTPEPRTQMDDHTGDQTMPAGPAGYEKPGRTVQGPSTPSGYRQMDDAPMTRADLIDALSDMGIDGTQLQGMSDEELQAMYDDNSDDSADDTGTAAGMDAGMGDPDQPATAMGDPSTMSRDEIVAELVAHGQDASQLDGMSDDDLKALYSQIVGGADAAPAPPTPATPAGPAAPMSDRTRRDQPIHRHAEERRYLRNLRRTNDAVEAELRRLRVSNAQSKRQDAEAFCDRLVREGRATPAMVPAMIMPTLLALDNTRALHKFTEDGVTRHLTAFERKKRELLKLPVIVRLGERAAAGTGGGGPEAEVRKVERFCEMYGTALRATTDPAKIVAKAQAMAKINPAFKAADLIGRQAAEMVV